MNNDKIMMKYPFSQGDSLYDGLYHEIIPINVVPIEINGRLFFIMIYDDLTINEHGLITLVTNVNGVYYKVPLNSEGYDILWEYVTNNQYVARISQANYIPRLNGPIELAIGMKLNKERNINFNNPNMKFSLEYYIPLNSNGEMRDDNIFTSRYLSSQDDCDTYVFGKSPVCGQIFEGLVSGSKYYCYGHDRQDFSKEYYNTDGVKMYEFELDIPENTFVNTSYKDKKGRTIFSKIPYIPGKYHITGYYSDFIKEEDFSDSVNCERIHIETETGDYRDLHDRPIVFKDGGAKKLDMIFNSSYGSKRSEKSDFYKKR